MIVPKKIFALVLVQVACMLTAIFLLFWKWRCDYVRWFLVTFGMFSDRRRTESDITLFSGKQLISLTRDLFISWCRMQLMVRPFFLYKLSRCHIVCLVSWCSKLSCLVCSWTADHCPSSEYGITPRAASKAQSWSRGLERDMARTQSPPTSELQTSTIASRLRQKVSQWMMYQN